MITRSWEEDSWGPGRSPTHSWQDPGSKLWSLAETILFLKVATLEGRARHGSRTTMGAVMRPQGAHGSLGTPLGQGSQSTLAKGACYHCMGLHCNPASGYEIHQVIKRFVGPNKCEFLASNTTRHSLESRNVCKYIQKGQNRVHMAPFGPIFAHNHSNGLWGASGMLPGPPALQKSKQSRVFGV